MKEDFNSFDRAVEMFADSGADTIVLENYRDGMVTGCPYNSKTGNYWLGFSMISSMEEALKCKYQKACSEDDKELNAKLAPSPLPPHE